MNIRHFINLLELNVVNVGEVEAKIKEIASKIAYGPSQKWFVSAARNFVINNETANSKISKLSNNAPDWMKQKKEQNVDLYIHRKFGNNKQMEFLKHMADWLNSLYVFSQKPLVNNDTKRGQTENRLITMAKKYISKVTVLNITELQSKNVIDKWFEAVNALAESDEGAIEVVKEYSDGYAWVDVKGENALAREGKLMQHCVGGYHQDVASGNTQIFSLRDDNNYPHVTIEISGSIKQVKGKQNEIPDQKYVPHVLDFLNDKDIDTFAFFGSTCYDLNHLGIKFDDENLKYYQNETFKKKAESTQNNRRNNDEKLVKKITDNSGLYVDVNTGAYELKEDDKTLIKFSGLDGAQTSLYSCSIYNFDLAKKHRNFLVAYLNERKCSVIYLRSFSFLGIGVVFSNENRWMTFDDPEIEMFGRGSIDYENHNRWQILQELDFLEAILLTMNEEDNLLYQSVKGHINSEGKFLYNEKSAVPFMDYINDLKNIVEKLKGMGFFKS